MPYIKSFRVAGLAGRSSATERTLNGDVNVFFGPNGSGKTSLLRILHSALLQNGDLLKEVPFSHSAVVVHSYSEGDAEYLFEKSPKTTTPSPATGTLLSRLRDNKPTWHVTPDSFGTWTHEYLPTSRLYEGGPGEVNLFSPPPDNSEMGLEARFASNLLNTWKDYTRTLARDLNKIQEEGLAKILERVVTRTEPSTKDKFADSSTAYDAVTTFLARRGVHDITSSEEFKRRYSKEPQFRHLVRDIEEVENKIARANEPIQFLQRLITEMFIGEKNLSLRDDAIEVAIAGQTLSLSMLSSGEKQLLKILVATVNAGASVLLIDEPELSMHVDWQRRLIPAMHSLNPSAQLIVATHSPEIMADIPDHQIFQL